MGPFLPPIIIYNLYYLQPLFPLLFQSDWTRPRPRFRVTFGKNFFDRSFVHDGALPVNGRCQVFDTFASPLVLSNEMV